MFTSFSAGFISTRTGFVHWNARLFLSSMKLTKKALQAIRDHSPAIKSKLALALNVSEASINRYIRGNSDNLTKVAALKVIEDETGLSAIEILKPE